MRGPEFFSKVTLPKASFANLIKNANGNVRYSDEAVEKWLFFVSLIGREY